METGSLASRNTPSRQLSSFDTEHELSFNGSWSEARDDDRVVDFVSGVVFGRLETEGEGEGTFNRDFTDESHDLT